MRKSISLVAALALSTTAAFAGYGSNAGYSTTKKINIENQQWVLVGYPGGGPVNTPSAGAGTVVAQDSVAGSSIYTGDIVSPLDWNQNATGDVNQTMTVGGGTEDNATFNLHVKSGYWSQLLAHSNYSIANVGEPAIVFTQGPSFMNLVAGGANGPIDGTMNIGLDGTDLTAAAILEINFNSAYLGKSFTLYLDANESNNTSYTMTIVNGDAYILNDPNTGTIRPNTNELLEFNTSRGTTGINNADGNFSFGTTGLNSYLGTAISKDANYTVAKFNGLGNSWMTYEANLTGATVITDGGLIDALGNVNRVEKGAAYWYRLNIAPTVTDLNMSVTVKDEDVGVNDLSLATDSWNLTALPKGHFKYSQGGIIVPLSATGYINFKGPVGDISSSTSNSIALQSAHSINGFIDGNGTLFEVPIRAYPMVSTDGGNDILIISDTQVDFNLSAGLVAGSIGGAKIGNRGKTKLGQSAIAIKMNDGFFNRVEAGTFTIEIPGLFDGFTGVDVNLSGLGSGVLLTGLTGIKSNISTAMLKQACLFTGGDYNITAFDSDFSGADDSLLIALNAKGERNVTADNTTPTECSFARGAYNDKYLRIGVRENTYVTPYLMKKDGNNSSALHIVDSSGNVYAKGGIGVVVGTTPDKGVVSISSNPNFSSFSTVNGIKSSLINDLNGTYLYGSYVDWNLTPGVAAANLYDYNYTYFITSNRNLRLAESNVSDFNLSGASKYSILSQTDKKDVFRDAKYLTSAVRTASPWVTNSADVNTTFLKGIISNVFTLADLAQAPLVAGGNLASASTGVAGYSSSTDLNINTVWAVDMPTSGPLYDIISATTGNTIPSRILTFRNGSYVSLNIAKTTNTSEWFDSEDLFFVSAFNGYWVRTDSQMSVYSINAATSADSGEKVIKTTYDMTSGTTSNYVFNKWIIDNVGSSSGLSTSMHNISIGDSNMSAQFTSVTNGAERYEVLIDPFTFSDFTETGFGATTKSIVITNGFTSSTLGSPITYSYTKPSAPIVTGTINDDLTVGAVDGTLEVHLSYVDEANLSFTRLFSTTDVAVTLKPQDLNVSSKLINDTYTMIGSEINETKIRFFNVGADGLSSDVTTVTYPLFNVLLINPTTSGGDYNLSLATSSDLNQTEWIDADGDGSGSKETQVVYNVLTDDGADAQANGIPSRYDINGTLITMNTAHPVFAGGKATDGVQILSSVSGKKVTLSYRPNGISTDSQGGIPNKFMDIYDGTSGVAKNIAKIGFVSNTNHYDYNGTKWYLYSEDTGKMYVGIFEVNATGFGTQTVDCSNKATNCNILSTTRTLSQ